MISNLPNLVARRDLLVELVRSDLRSSTAQTRLGWLWWLLDPLMMMLVYFVIVVELFGRGDMYSPYWLFVFFGLITWKHLTGSVNRASNVLSRRQGLIRAVPFPTMVLPLSGVLSMFVFFLCGFAVLTAMAIVAPLPHHSGGMLPLIQIPLLMILQVIMIAGIALPISCIGVLYRDLSELIPHALQAGFFLSPTLYGADLVERTAIDRLGPQLGAMVYALYMLNPFAIIITGYRDSMFYGRFMEPQHWIVLLIEAAAILFIGYRIYQHYDRRVIKFL
jgi:ABC-type polysaccharide/polyol phosphate export permease